MTPAEFRKIREDAGFNQTELARWIPCSDRYVRMIETGERKPSGPIIHLMRLLEGGGA